MENDLIIRKLVVGSLSANCYVVGSISSGEGLVIDPGGDAEVILKTLKEVPFFISLILLSHGHSDHIAALYEIRQATGAEMAIHTEDEQFLHGYGPYSSQFGISYKTPGKADQLLEEGDIIGVKGISFSVIHTPGHTPGSVCFLLGSEIFTGDTLFYRGIGTTLMPGSSRSQLMNSIRTKLMCLPEDTVIYPGHGRITTIGAERNGNPYLRRC